MSAKVEDVSHSSSRYNGFQFTFKRVTVILGANGSGKSKLLTEVKDDATTLTGGGKAVYIEGGRTIKIKDVLQLDHTNVGQFDRYETAINHYENKRSSSLADRVFDALVVLDKRDSNVRAKHSDAVESWHRDGMKGAYPARKQPPLQRLFELFNEIFPQITLAYASDSRQLTAAKNGSTYGPSGLSDGEKQVFSILADLIELEEAHKLIVADEPELNLHPELAERLWTLVENEFPGKRFVYATHSINFALRENVESVYVLSSDSSNILVFAGLDSLPRAEVTAFLGGLPGILSANRVLVTEGHEKSFDAIFYRWLMGDDKLEIYPGGGCADVEAIVGKSGLWEKISSRISLSGVVDGDFRSDDQLEAIESGTVHALRLHEAESYLCLPSVLCAIAERIASQEVVLSEDEVVRRIVDRLSREKLLIAARRVFAKSRITLRVSVERSLLAAAPDREALVVEIRSAANAEAAKAGAIAPDKVEALFDNEVAAIEEAIKAEDVMKALALLPGKELLAELAPRAGFRNSTDLMRSFKNNFRPTDFPEIASLAARLTPGTSP